MGEYENYKGEVIAQTPKAGTEIGSQTKIVLDIGFQSAVDYMPYQFFYGLGGSATSRTDDWDLQSRKLMAPFDAAVMRYTSIAQRDALTFSLSFVEEQHLHRFLRLFDFEAKRYVDSFSELVFYFTLLPFYHHWAGNARLVQEALSHLVGYNCRIIENVEGLYDIPKEIQSSLGSSNGRLGQTSVIGRSFTECDSAYYVIVRDVVPEDISRFVPGGHMREKLEMALDFCMPGNLVSKIKILGKQETMKIGKQADVAYLGYSSYV